MHFCFQISRAMHHVLRGGGRSAAAGEPIEPAGRNSPGRDDTRFRRSTCGDPEPAWPSHHL